MQVNVKLYSRFRELLPDETKGEATIELPRGASVGDLLDHLGIDSRVRLITIDGEPEADRERCLDDGERVHIFPFVVGG